LSQNGPVERFAAASSQVESAKKRLDEMMIRRRLVEDSMAKKLEEIRSKHGVDTQEALAAKVQELGDTISGGLDDLESQIAELRKKHPEMFNA